MGLVRTGVAATLLVVLALTGIVNVWLGVHWPSDVLGGYLWGAVLLLPAVAAGERLQRDQEVEGQGPTR